MADPPPPCGPNNRIALQWQSWVGKNRENTALVLVAVVPLGSINTGRVGTGPRRRSPPAPFPLSRRLGFRRCRRCRRDRRRPRSPAARTDGCHIGGVTPVRPAPATARGSCHASPPPLRRAATDGAATAPTLLLETRRTASPLLGWLPRDLACLRHGERRTRRRLGNAARGANALWRCAGVHVTSGERTRGHHATLAARQPHALPCGAAMYSAAGGLSAAAMGREGQRGRRRRLSCCSPIEANDRGRPHQRQDCG